MDNTSSPSSSSLHPTEATPLLTATTTSTTSSTSSIASSTSTTASRTLIWCRFDLLRIAITNILLVPLLSLLCYETFSPPDGRKPTVLFAVHVLSMAVFLWGLVNGIILLNSAPPRAKKTGKSVHAYLKIVTLLSLLSGMISITINKALKHPRIPSTPHNLVDDETPEASVSSASAFFETHYRSLHGLLGALCLLICLSIGFIGMFVHWYPTRPSTTTSLYHHLLPRASTKRSLAASHRSIGYLSVAIALSTIPALIIYGKWGPRVFPNPIVRYTLSIIMVIVWALVVLLARPAPVSNADKGIVRYLRRGATKISATSGGKTSRAVKAVEDKLGLKPCECSRCFGLSEVREGVVAVSPENHVRSEGEQVIVTIDGNDAANP